MLFFLFISKHLTCVIFDWPLIRLSVNISGYTQDIFSTQGPVVYEAGPFIYIRNAAFFLNFADLLLQEQDERISGDCLGTFFLKFRGPAVARAR